jgi:hypothetical protein
MHIHRFSSSLTSQIIQPRKRIKVGLREEFSSLLHRVQTTVEPTQLSYAMGRGGGDKMAGA